MPKFSPPLREPVVIRMEDQRPEIQKGMLRDPEWIYFRTPPGEQSDLLAHYLGNALTALGAAPAYVLSRAGEPMPVARLVIRIEYLEGYARWPVKADRQRDRVPVEGSARIRYELLQNGKRTDHGTLSHSPNDFEVPVRIFTRDNVREVVGQSLSHQFDLTTTSLLDEFMWILAEDWPER